MGIFDSLTGAKAAKAAASRAFPDFLKFRNEVFSGSGGFLDQMAGLRADPTLRAAEQGLFQKAPGIIDELQRNLVGGALGSTSGGQVAALESARAAAGGRGGLAFGGGAGRVAAAGARAVAPQQAGMLGQALSQGAGMRLQNIQAQGQFAFNKRAGELALRQQFLQGQFGLAGGAQQQIQAATSAEVGAKSSAFSGTLGFLGNVLG